MEVKSIQQNLICNISYDLLKVPTYIETHMPTSKELQSLRTVSVYFLLNYNLFSKTYSHVISCSVIKQIQIKDKGRSSFLNKETQVK